MCRVMNAGEKYQDENPHSYLIGEQRTLCILAILIIWAILYVKQIFIQDNNIKSTNMACKEGEEAQFVPILES